LTGFRTAFVYYLQECYDVGMPELAVETYQMTGDVPEYVRKFGSAVVGTIFNPPANFKLISNPLDTEYRSVAAETETTNYPNIPSTQLSFWRNGLVVASARLPGKKLEDETPTSEELHLFKNGDLTRFVYHYPTPLNVRLAAARLHVDRTDKAEVSKLDSQAIAIIRQRPKAYIKGEKPILMESVVGVSEAKVNRITKRLAEIVRS
jgi:hypothetical protein